MISATLILIGLMFGIYFVLSGLEFGVAAQYLVLGKNFTKESFSKLTPLWEIANIFLAVGVAGFIRSFSNVAPPLFRAIKPVIIVGLIALILRVVLIVYLFYSRKKEQFSGGLGLAFATSSLAVPISLGLAGISLLTGTYFWQNSVGWVMTAGLLFSALALGTAFMYYRLTKTRKNYRATMHGLSILYCLVTAIGLQIVVNSTYQLHLVSGFYGLFVMLVAVTALVQIILRTLDYDYLLWCYLSLVIVLSPVLLALANRPYIIYPSVSLVRAYSTVAGRTSIIGMSISLIMVVVLGLFLLVRQSKNHGQQEVQYRT